MEKTTISQVKTYGEKNICSLNLSEGLIYPTHRKPPTNQYKKIHNPIETWAKGIHT